MIRRANLGRSEAIPSRRVTSARRIQGGERRYSTMISRVIGPRADNNCFSRRCAAACLVVSGFSTSKHLSGMTSRTVPVSNDQHKKPTYSSGRVPSRNASNATRPTSAKNGSNRSNTTLLSPPNPSNASTLSPSIEVSPSMYETLCAICGPATKSGVDQVVSTGSAAQSAFLADGRQCGKVSERV